MGVRGLSTLVDENKDSLLSDHKLHDTRVIIDGSNLYHFLYYHYKVPVQYGGDYDHYARKCKHFFNTLRMCNVEPYVVLDGGYDPNDRKLTEVLDRMVSRRLRAGMICHKGRGCVLPIMSYETFHQVMVELRIAHVSSRYEADREIAVLAHRWKCPVMSNDSDFFVYGMAGGYVPLDYINMTLCLYDTQTDAASVLETVRKPSNHEFIYLPVKYYHYENFTSRFRQKNADFILPMFATLTGNDYVDPSILSQFYAQIHVPKNPSKKAFNLKAQTHMLAILYWLDTMDNGEEALDHVLEHVPKARRSSVSELLLRSITDYRDIQNFESLQMDVFLEHIYSDKTIEPISEYVVPELLDFNRELLPIWFVERVRNCQITSTFLQNVTVNRRVIFSCQIENLREPSTYACSRDIRSVIYGITMKSATTSSSNSKSRETEASGNKGLKKTSVEEYDRDGKNTRKVYVEPKVSVTFGSQTCVLPDLADVPGMCVENRKQILFASLGVTTEVAGEFTDDALLLLIGVLNVWIKNANPKVMESHLNALIIGVIMLHVQVTRWYNKKQETGADALKPVLLTNVSEAIEAHTGSRVDHFLKLMDKHKMKPDMSTRCSREGRIIHGFSQFQACFLDTLYLNQVLLFPVDFPSPSVILSSMFLYNVCKNLETRPKPQFYIEELLSKDYPLHKLFVKWKGSVMDLCRGSLPEGFESGNKTIGSKSRKKAKSKKCKNEKKQERESPEDMSEDSGESSELYYDVNNKFALLGLD